MSDNTPAIIPAAMRNLVMAPPEDLLPLLAERFGGAFEDFSSQFRNISFRGFQFTLREAGSSTVYPNATLPVVILGVAPDNHCTYYTKTYGAGDENLPPDFVWWQKSGFPASLPPAALQKDENGRNRYQISRRICVAVLQQNAQTGEMFIDLDHPYVADIGSMSIFGADNPEHWAFSLSGLMRMCDRMRLMPAQFVTQLVFDRTKTVPAIRFVPAHQDGQIIFLDNAALAAVYNTARSTAIGEMLVIKPRVPSEPTTGLPQPGAAPVPTEQPVMAPVQQVVAAPPQPTPTPVQQPIAPQPVSVVQPSEDLMAQATSASAEAAQLLQQPAPVAAPVPMASPAPAPAPAPAPQPMASPAPATDNNDMNNALANLLTDLGSLTPTA